MLLLNGTRRCMRTGQCNSTFVLSENRVSSRFRNQSTPNDTVVYLIVKVTVTISQPVPMELVFRKRIAVTFGRADRWLSSRTLRHYLGNVNSRLRCSMTFLAVLESESTNECFLRGHLPSAAVPQRREPSMQFEVSCKSHFPFWQGL